MPKIKKITANGKMFLTGEHAVLYGYHAIAFAISNTLSVEIQQREDKKVVIQSDKYGYTIFDLGDKIKLDKPQWFDMIIFLANSLSPCGLKIDIKSQIPDGFGSSGALFACLTAGLLSFGKPFFDKKQLAFDTLKLYREYYRLLHNNPLPSGMDIITSICGGVVYFSPTKQNIIKIPYSFLNKLPLYAIFTGKKTSTENVVNFIKQNIPNSGKIYSKINRIVNDIYHSLIDWDEDKFFNKIIANQKLLAELNLCDEDTTNILKFCKQKNIIAKISGAGQGDYVLSFGELFKKKDKARQTFKYDVIPINIDDKGIIIEDL